LEKKVEREVGSQGGSGAGGDDLWKDMVAAEEERIKERDARHKEYVEKHAKKQNGKKAKKEDEDEK